MRASRHSRGSCSTPPGGVPHGFRQIGPLLGDDVACLVDRHRAAAGGTQIDADVAGSDHKVGYQGSETGEDGCQPGARCSTTTVV